LAGLQYLCFPLDSDDPYMLLLVCVQPAPQRPVYIYTVPPRTILPRSAVGSPPHTYLTWLPTRYGPDLSTHETVDIRRRQNYPLTVRLQLEIMHTLQTFYRFHHFLLMFSCRLFVQWLRRSFAKYGHPRLFSQLKICKYQTNPRFGSFESVQEKAEKFALYVENHEFENLHSCQPIVHHDDSLQRHTQTCYIWCDMVLLLMSPCVLHPNTSQTSNFCQTNGYTLCRSQAIL